MDIAFLTYFLIPYRSKKKYLVGSTMRKQCKANWIGYQIVIKNNFAGLGMESGRMSSYPLMDYMEWSQNDIILSWLTIVNVWVYPD